MRYPKSWNKFTLREQESWLVKEYVKICKEQDNIVKILSSVRGGFKYITADNEDRPDLIELKGE
jgi:hypothetical protein